MYIVKMKDIKYGKEKHVAAFETEADALEKIISRYRIDERIGQLGEYYYYMKKV